MFTQQGLLSDIKQIPKRINILMQKYFRAKKRANPEKKRQDRYAMWS